MPQPLFKVLSWNATAGMHPRRERPRQWAPCAPADRVRRNGDGNLLLHQGLSDPLPGPRGPCPERVAAEVEESIPRAMNVNVYTLVNALTKR